MTFGQRIKTRFFRFREWGARTFLRPPSVTLLSISATEAAGQDETRSVA